MFRVRETSSEASVLPYNWAHASTSATVGFLVIFKEAWMFSDSELVVEISRTN